MTTLCWTAMSKTTILRVIQQRIMKQFSSECFGGKFAESEKKVFEMTQDCAPRTRNDFDHVYGKKTAVWCRSLAEMIEYHTKKLGANIFAYNDVSHS